MIADLWFLLWNAILISLITFGGGSQALFYQTMVTERNLITSDDLSAILAFGYATPGPAVFGTATFVGYSIAGLPGAIIGSIGIFLMPFLLALVAAKYIAHWLEHPYAKLFIKGIGLAAAGVVAAIAISIVESNESNIGHILITIGAFLAMVFWKKANPLFVLVAGLVMGVIAS
jgi:chromate transporter